ncbi:hypothetical protein [Bacillus xiamenensis]|uniref:hypothetical protein n=1 Tax=Bacillus xiamenensis TaxID=1178537 RepID=UPI00028E7304|nr:hypothetical protein [Bacillus xiamenensis]EKF35066.1 hypothetical protein BA1_12019 [Bacillus xiamenensis]
MFLELTEDEKKQLEYEVILPKTRLALTRYLRTLCLDEEYQVRSGYLNRIINIANHILGKEIFIYDDYEEVEGKSTVVQMGHLELILKISNTVQFIEIILDLLNNGLIELNIVNRVLKTHNASFKIEELDGDFIIEIDDLTEKEQFEDVNEHKNIRSLIERMKNMMNDEDYAGVLHTAASIAETLAKEVVQKPSIVDKSLGSFIGLYKKETKLPESFIDYIKYIYNKRNSEPLSGHGSINEPSITKAEAIIISEMTKAFVIIEKKLMIQN